MLTELIMGWYRDKNLEEDCWLDWWREMRKCGNCDMTQNFFSYPYLTKKRKIITFPFPLFSYQNPCNQAHPAFCVCSILFIIFICCFCAGLKPAAFAALVPNSANKLLIDVAEEIMGDHEMMVHLWAFHIRSHQMSEFSHCNFCFLQTAQQASWYLLSTNNPRSSYRRWNINGSCGINMKVTFTAFLTPWRNSSLIYWVFSGSIWKLSFTSR